VPKTVRVAVGDETTTATSYAAKRGRATLVLAHGAGAGQKHAFMVRFAKAIAARGVDVVTFDFLYIARKKKLPDRNDALEACWRAVIAKTKGRPLFIGGKSMGGRIATQVAAAGDAPIAGVVCLGYPLHPPGRPEKLRVEHLPKVRVPVLFCQGERDAFGTPAELRPWAKKMHDARIVAIEGDHSFAVTKRASQDDVYARAVDAIVTWIDGSPGD